MYGNLTDRACRVILEMEGEAFVLDHDHVGTEHLLIAIVEVNDDVTGPVLSRFGVSTERLRREVRSLVTPGIDFDNEWQSTFVMAPGPDEAVASPEPIIEPGVSNGEFTPRLRECLSRLARAEAELLGDHHVGPEHMLLAVLREGKGVGVQALQNLDVDAGELKSALYEKIADDPAAGDSTAPRPTEEEQQAALEVRRMGALSGMRPEERVIFTSEYATMVFCVLDGIERLYNSEHRDETIQQVTMVLSESFSRKADNTSGFTSSSFTPEAQQFLAKVVGSLRRRAADQLGD
jgi:ATP-dependent Clp protease ATP-binding subunit ClpA